MVQVNNKRSFNGQKDTRSLDKNILEGQEDDEKHEVNEDGVIDQKIL